MNTHDMPRIVPTIFENLNTIAVAASKAGKKIAVVRHPCDGGPAAWDSSACRAIVADLSHSEGQIAAGQILDDPCDVLIITLATDRSISPFTYAPGEISLVNELFWRRAGAAGKLNYPSLG
ncbi:hypothetical protein [Pararhizobium sp. DWP3-4]|uniref:hypothetical protein n=1 Tax=Pararhizobium sp. DWP3-4 TaxID=2804565 RepID=UPI003CF30E5C